MCRRPPWCRRPLSPFLSPRSPTAKAVEYVLLRLLEGCVTDPSMTVRIKVGEWVVKGR